MFTVKELRQYCEQLHNERKEELKSVLNDYFERAFITRHRPFKAVVGNKRCKPIPIHRGFLVFSRKAVLNYKIQWPNFSEDLLRKELENLGFIITNNRISISVPPYEKGAKMSFAQEWVKKINASYSDYCANEKKIANEMYSEFILALRSIPAESIRIYDGYTLFCDFKVDYKISSKCATFMKRLMKRDGIAECYEDGKYMGIKVYNSHTNY